MRQATSNKVGKLVAQLTRGQINGLMHDAVLHYEECVCDGMSLDEATAAADEYILRNATAMVNDNILSAII
jgi:hypothetical protein